MIYLIVIIIGVLLLSYLLSGNKKDKEGDKEKDKEKDKAKGTDEKKKININHSNDMEKLNELNILIFDCETTALKPGKICQLSYVISSHGDVKAKNFYFKVNYVGPEAENIHKLNVDKLKKLSNGMRFKDHYEEIKLDFENADVLIAHNFDFDIKFIKTEFSRLGYKFNEKSSFCTMKSFTDICKISRYRDSFEYKYPKLSELVTFLHIDKNYIKTKAMEFFDDKVIGFHDARFDVTATYLSFIKGIEEGYIKLGFIK